MKNIINCICARYSEISTITHSAKYRLIIVIIYLRDVTLRRTGCVRKGVLKSRYLSECLSQELRILSVLHINL